MAFIAKRKSGSVSKSSASKVSYSPTFSGITSKSGKGNGAQKVGNKAGFYEDQSKQKGFKDNTLAGFRNSDKGFGVKSQGSSQVPNARLAMDLKGGAEKLRKLTHKGKYGIAYAKSASNNPFNNDPDKSGSAGGSPQNPQFSKGGKGTFGFKKGKGDSNSGSFINPKFGKIKKLKK